MHAVAVRDGVWKILIGKVIAPVINRAISALYECIDIKNKGQY